MAEYPWTEVRRLERELRDAVARFNRGECTASDCNRVQHELNAARADAYRQRAINEKGSAA